jgi:CRP-like cAMP-binding protein
MKVPEQADGRTAAAMLLATLSIAKVQSLGSALQRVELRRGAVIQDADSPAEYGYFMESGVISTQVTTRHARTVEVGMVGPEGFLPLSLVMTFRTPGIRAVVQVPGEALRVGKADLRQMVRQSDALQQSLFHYFCFRSVEAAHLAACNALHQVEARLARWLLMVQDRLDDKELLVTHEVLGQMLATNRATISLTAERLKRAGLISYGRGRVRISDRAALQSVACECYESVSGLLSRYKQAHLGPGAPGGEPEMQGLPVFEPRRCA